MSFFDYDFPNMSDLIGKTFTLVRRENYLDNDAILFTSNEGERYILTHLQDCFEHVYIEDICGDLKDLENIPILESAEIDGESPGFSDVEYEPESYTWTFFKLGTIKGSVTIRFFGSSNGCYNESAGLCRLKDKIND